MANDPNKRWQRASTEVAFVVCDVCYRRLEVEIDNRGDTVTRLYYHFLLHSYEHVGRLYVDERKFRASIHTEYVVFDEPTPLDDIISQRSLDKRTAKLARRSATTSKRARAFIEQRLRLLLELQQLRFGAYACIKCFKPITKSRAERFGGIGVLCSEITTDVSSSGVSAVAEVITLADRRARDR